MSSVRPFCATALILTLSPARSAASTPASTSESAPRREIAANVAASSVSNETFTRFTPQAASSSACCASCEPLVVSVSSSSSPRAQAARQRLDQIHHAAPHQRLAAGQPDLLHPEADEDRAQPIQFLEPQHFGVRQERHLLRHAIDAAEIAAIGHRQPDVGDRAAERIDEPRRRAAAAAAAARASVPGGRRVGKQRRHGLARSPA